MRISYFFTITFSIHFSSTWSGIDFLCMSLQDLKNVKNVNIVIFIFPPKKGQYGDLSYRNSKEVVQNCLAKALTKYERPKVKKDAIYDYSQNIPISYEHVDFWRQKFREICIPPR